MNYLNPGAKYFGSPKCQASAAEDNAFIGRNVLADRALECVGTPFHPGGREPDRGLDCVGLIIVAAAAAGLEIADREYVIGPGVDLFDLMTEAAASAFVKSDLPLERGDVLTMRFPKTPYHAAVYVGGNRIVHAMAGRGVGLMCLDSALCRRIEAVWRLP